MYVHFFYENVERTHKDQFSWSRCFIQHVLQCNNSVKGRLPLQMKTKEELEEAIKDTITGYKEIIFGQGTPVCMACLDELRRQQVINQKVYDQKLMNNMTRKLTWKVLQKTW